MKQQVDSKILGFNVLKKSEKNKFLFAFVCLVIVITIILGIFISKNLKQALYYDDFWPLYYLIIVISYGIASIPSLLFVRYLYACFMRKVNADAKLDVFEQSVDSVRKVIREDIELNGGYFSALGYWQAINLHEIETYKQNMRENKEHKINQLRIKYPNIFSENNVTN